MALTDKLTAIADAVRSKTGGTEMLTLDDIAAAIRSLNVQVVIADLVEYLQWNQAVQNFVENVVYDTDYTVSHINEYVDFSDRETSAYPTGYTVEGTENGQTVEITQSGILVFSDAVTGENYTIYNLIPKKEYLYTVKRGEASVKAGYIKPLGQVRQIRTLSVWNMRDLGGWNGSAGTIKYGLIYRSGHFDSISDEDKTLLRDVLKIKEDIDIRSAADAGSVSKLGTDIAFLNAPMVGYADDFARTDQLKMIFADIFSRAEAGEAVDFHCSAGCDRTGTIAYIVLALLGVSQSDIDKDYELTTMSLSDTQAHRTTESYASMVTGYITELTGNTLEEKIIRYFINTLKFTSADINGFRNAMLTEQPKQYYSVKLNLINVTIDNNSDLITEGAYSASITYDSGADLSVSVTMGGTDVTDSAVSGNVITISNVTGDIIITATAASEVSYTNILDTVGYYDDQYLSGTSGMKASTTGDVTTGYIGIDDLSEKTIYIKGYSESASASHTRIRLQASQENTEYVSEVNGFLASAQSWYTVESLGTGYYSVTFAKLKEYFSGAQYVRMCFAATKGENLIITIDEPIE